jgi:hypothetical protein
MQLSSEVHIPDGLLAANALLAENSRLGLPTSMQAPHPGIGFRISSTAMDFQFRCSGIVSDPVVAPNNPVPANPCSESGNAPDPHFYQQKGLNDRFNPVSTIADLQQFPRGGDLDAQPNGGSRAYGNYVYGVYMRAAGFPLFIATAGARWYSSRSNAQYGPADGTMSGSIPTANVANITNGYNAQKNGTVCKISIGG